jgi:hypothetical protein
MHDGDDERRRCSRNNLLYGLVPAIRVVHLAHTQHVSSQFLVSEALAHTKQGSKVASVVANFFQLSFFSAQFFDLPTSLSSTVCAPFPFALYPPLSTSWWQRRHVFGVLLLPCLLALAHPNPQH